MNQKIKVLYTIPNFDTAGSGKVVYDLVKYIDKDKFEVAIACDHSRGEFFKVIEQLGVTIYIQPMTTLYRPYISLYQRVKTIAKFIKKHQFDIVHSWHWSSDWTEVLAARMGGAKYVYTKKAMSWGNKHWKIKSYLSNYILTINPEMQKYFSYKKNQKLIPLGIDTNFYSSSNFQKKVSESNFEVVTVANLVPVKGIEVLIKAIKIIGDESIHLKIVGDTKNSYADYLKKLCSSLFLNEQVSFIGKKNDVRKYIADSDIYVIPTLDTGRKEGFGVALIEAMSMGVPVIGSRTSGIKYILENYQDFLFDLIKEKYNEENNR
mgnify:CR=1 FL=1